MSFNLINDLKQLGSLLGAAAMVIGVAMQTFPVEPVQRYGGLASAAIGAALLIVHKVTDACAGSPAKTDSLPTPGK